MNSSAIYLYIHIRIYVDEDVETEKYILWGHYFINMLHVFQWKKQEQKRLTVKRLTR